MTLLIPLLGLVSGLLLLRAYLQRAKERQISESDRAYAAAVARTMGESTADLDQRRDAGPGRVTRIADAATRSGLLRSREARDVLDWLERELTLAGRPKGWSAAEALVATIIFWIVAGGLLGFLGMSAGAPSLLLAVVVGFIFAYPPLKLRQMRRRRQEQARLELMSFITDLIMGIGSGQGSLDDALSRTVADPRAIGAERILVREFAQAYAMYRHGNYDREEALREAADRLGVEEVDNFVDALVQGHRTGSPIRDTLTSQVDQIQAIYEQEMRAFIARKQSSFVVSLVFILMGILILVLYPLVSQILDAFSGA